jgi:putative phage-type endonuclease
MSDATKVKRTRRPTMKVGVEDCEKGEAHHHVAMDAACRTVVADRCLLLALERHVDEREREQEQEQEREQDRDSSCCGASVDADAGIDMDLDFDAALRDLVGGVGIDNTRQRRRLQPTLLGASMAMATAGRRIAWADVEARARLAVEARSQLALLLRAPGIEQRTPAWYDARMGMITASDVAQALGAGKFGTQRAFFQKKCGAPEEQSPFDATLPPLKWGTMFEPVAQALYSARNRGVRVHEFGLLRHPDPALGFVGASPDGITDLGVMLEIKCPWRRQIVPGELPMQYYYQIQVQLAVTRLTECDYFECQFEEAEDEEDPDWVGADPEERGVFVEFPAASPSSGSGAPRYAYPAPQEDAAMATAEQCRAWVERVVASAVAPRPLSDCDGDGDVGAPAAPQHRAHWWVLRQSACARVVADRAFVADVFSRLAIVWERVLLYRGDRTRYLADVGSASAPAQPLQLPFSPFSPCSPATATTTTARFQQPQLPTYAFVDDDGQPM